MDPREAFKIGFMARCIEDALKRVFRRKRLRN
jgi:hypothetical protein